MELTKFPCLEELFDSENARLASIKLSGSFSNKDVLCLAWASILMSYTGVEQVKFLLDKECIAVNQDDWIVARKPHVDEAGSQSSGITRISIDGPFDTGAYALELIRDVEGNLSLQSKGYIPQSHLEQLSKELEIALDWFSKNKSSVVPALNHDCLQKSIDNPHPITLKGPGNLHDLIDFNSNKIALSWCDESGLQQDWTYHELNIMVQSLEKSIRDILSEFPQRKQPVIALFLSQSPSLYVAQLATLRLGCAFCPINLDTPSERIKFILNDVEAALILTMEGEKSKLEFDDRTCQIFNVDNILASESPEQVELPCQPFLNVTPDDVAYIMYTSGSTGLPKGVPITHLAVTQSLLAHDEHIPRYTRFLQFAAPTFDVSIFEIFFTFFRGASLVCSERTTMLNDLPGFIKRLDIDAMELTPSVAGSLIRNRSLAPKLKLLLTIGEMLTKSVVSEFGGSATTDSILWAMYGPTEAAIHCTLQSAFDSRFRVNNIGRPLATVSSFILELQDSGTFLEEITEKNLCPIGHVGELVVGGVQLAKFYLKKPDQTAAAFIPKSPWGPLYRTGDKARMLPNGSFECLGRVSSGQVKLRGQRLELGEVEQTALKVKDCRNAVADVIDGVLVLFSYIQSTNMSHEVVECCKMWLPSYMVPGEYIFLREFPLLASGKVDRKRLRENYLQNRNSTEDIFEEESEASAKIVSLIEELLGHPVTLGTTLSSAGIDSLMAIRLAAVLQKSHHSASAMTILRCKTVKDLSRIVNNQSEIPMNLVETRNENGATVDKSHVQHLLPKNEVDNIQYVYKCTPIQKAMLAETLRDPLMYWNSVTFQFSSCSPEMASSWIKHIISSNEILRAGFIDSELSQDPFLQIVWKKLPDSAMKTVKDKSLISTMEEINLLNPLQIRIWSNGKDTRVHFLLHHAIYDGWSMDLLCDDLNRLANGTTLNPRLQFSTIQHHYAERKFESNKSFWLRNLDDVLVSSIGNYSNAPASRNPVSVSIDFDLETQLIRNLAAKLQISTQVFFQAAIISTLSQLTETTDLIIAMVTSGRAISVPGIESVLGPCLNTLPLRVNVAHSEMMSDLLMNIHRLNREILENSQISLRDIKKTLGIAPTVQLTDVIFIWQESIPSGKTNEKVIMLDAHDNMEFGLAIEIQPTVGKIVGKMTYHQEIFSEQRISEIQRIFKNTLLQYVTSLENDEDEVLHPDRQNLTTSNQKLRHSTLQSIERHDSDNSDEWSFDERQVALTVSRIAKIPIKHIHRTSLLFKYGIDSISSIHLARALREQGFHNASVSTILRNPSIEQLTKALRAVEEDLSTKSDELGDLDLLPESALRVITAQLQQNGIEGDAILPCTPLQEAMLASSLGQEASSYVTRMVFKIKGDIERMQNAWVDIMERHQIFRTCFVQTDLNEFPFVQVPRYKVESNSFVELVDFATFLDAKQVEKEISNRLEKHQPPVLVRISKSTEGCFLDLTCHHAVYDATAIQNCITEIENFCRGIKPVSASKPNEFLLRTIKALKEDHAKFWVINLKGIQPLVLNSKTSHQSSNTQTSHAQLSLSLSDIENVSKNLQCTLSTLIQASLAKLLSFLTKSTDICFGSVTGNRDEQNFEGLVFPTFNTVPIRVDFNTHSSNQNLVNFLQQFSLDSKPFSFASLRRIQTSLGLLESRLFFALLILQNGPYITEPKFWEMEAETGSIDFPLVVEFVPDRILDTLTLTLQYHDGIFIDSDTPFIDFQSLFEICIKSIFQFPEASSKRISSTSFTSLSLNILNDTNSEMMDFNDSKPEVGLTKYEELVQHTVSKLRKTPKDQIHMKRTIFHYGIDSIAVIQLASRLSSESGRRIMAAEILQNPLLGDVAKCLETTLGADRIPIVPFNFEGFDSETKKILPDEFDSISKDSRFRPCTPSQTGLLSQLLKTQSLYVNYMAFKFEMNSTSLEIKNSVSKLVARHDILRTGFASIRQFGFDFIMITYPSLNLEDRLEIFNHKMSDKMNLDEWRFSAITEFAENIHRPPWKMVLELDSNGFTMHLVIFHGLYDAHSLRLLLKDFTDILMKRSLKTPLSSDIILNSVISRTSKQDSEKSRHLSKKFWRSQFGDDLITENAPSPTSFPNLSPLRTSFNRKEIRTLISSKTLNSLENSCHTQGFTLLSAGQAAFAEIISAYVGQQGITFGVVFSGRGIVPGDQNCIFPCMTTVPFPIKVEGNRRDLVSKVSSFNAKVRDHQFASATDIAKWSGYANEKLFDTIFAFQKFPDFSYSVPMRLEKELATDEYILAFEMEPWEESLRFQAIFDVDRIPTEQAELLLQQFDTVLTEIANSIDSSNKKKSPTIYSISPANTPTLQSPVLLLHQFVEKSARDMPNSPAFQFVDDISPREIKTRTWTYTELNDCGNRIASLLVQKGLAPLELVAICFEKCPEASFAILGILKAGCAYVALDPQAPLARKQYIVKETKARFLLTANRETSFLSAEIDQSLDLGVTVLYLDEINLNSISLVDFDVPTEPHHLCYCLYTSGTTGKPKGCRITHENAVQAMRAFSILFSGRWDKSSRWLQFASFHFDVSVLELFWTWSERICVVSAPRDLLLSNLQDFIKRLEITHIDLTPSLATLLTPEEVPSLCKGVFITGGEALRQDILDKWGEREVIHNGYGPTEATIGVTMYPRVPHNGKPSNIGWQFENVGAYVFCVNTTTPVFRGAVGELCVAGKLVGDGYLNDPILSQAKFETLDSGERIYRTGDHVRMLHDGSFDFLGRADEQVKLRGQRLEIDEINSVIKKTPDLLSVATYVLRHPDQTSKQIVSFVVFSAAEKSSNDLNLEQGSEISHKIGQIRKSCRENLPPYMIPTFILPINTMPLTTNNKVARNVLHNFFNSTTIAQLQQYDTVQDSGRSELNIKEAQIGQIIEKMFGVTIEDIFPNSNLFQFIDSISVIGFTRELIKSGFTKATIAMVLKNDTVEGLATALSATQMDPEQGSILSAKQEILSRFHRYCRHAAHVLSVDAREIEAIAPCTPLQESMIHNNLIEARSSYFSTFTKSIGRDMNLGRLKGAWNSAYDNIDILRTKFISTEDGYIQIVLADHLPWFQLNVDEKNVATIISSSRDRWVLQNRDNIVQPIQLILYENSKLKERTLVLNIFHGLYDGISLPLILDRVNAEYYGSVGPSLSPSFHMILPFGPLRKQPNAREFWRNRIAPHWCHLPRQGKHDNATTVSYKAEFHNTDLFEKRRREFGLTHQSILQTCWSSVLQNLCCGKILLGLVVSGRSIAIENVDQTIGPLFNTILYQSDIHSGTSWLKAIKSTQTFIADSSLYQHSSLLDITQFMEQEHGIRPKLDNLFVFHLYSRKSTDVVEMNNWAVEPSNPEALYPISLDAEYFQDCLKLHLVVDSRYLSNEEAQNALNELLTNLNMFLSDPNSIIDVPSTTVSSQNQQMANVKSNVQIAPHSTNFVWTETAKILRSEISRLVSIEEKDITETTSIFALGCDSIDAIKLVGILKRQGIQVNLSTIMRHSSISSLLNWLKTHATSLSNGSGFQKDTPSFTLTDQAQVKSRPATPLQESMFSEMINSNFDHYFNHDILKIMPGIDLSRLKQAWNSCISHHEILRTTFQISEDVFSPTTFVQVVRDDKPIEWKDFRINEENEIAQVLQNIKEHAQKLPDTDPQMVLSWLFVKNEPHLILSLPHAMYDGWSIGLLHYDLWKAYHGSSTDRPSIDIAIQQIMNGTNSESAKFWKDYLFRSKRCLIQQSKESQTSSQIVHRGEIQSKVKISDIKHFCRQESITPHILTQTCWSLVLAHQCQQLEVSYGVVLSGRDSEELQNVAFPTMNTVAFRTILHGNYRTLIRELQKDISGILEHQNFPLSKALRSSGNNQQLFNSLFLFQSTSTALLDMEASPLYTSIQASSNVDYPVCVEVEVTSNGLIWRVACNAETMSENDAKMLLNQLDQILSHIIINTEAEVLHYDETFVQIGCLPKFDGSVHFENSQSSSIPDSDGDGHPHHGHLELELVLSQVLAQVVGVQLKQFSREVSIFAYGLDSISAIKLSHQLRKRDIHLSVSTILKHPTVAQLAKQAWKSAFITDKLSQDVPKSLDFTSFEPLLKRAGLESSQIKMILPATAGQVLFLSTWIQTNGQKFLSNFYFDLGGVYSLDKCQSAWSTLVRQNPILRTIFIRSSDSNCPVYQIILEEFPNAEMLNNLFNDQYAQTQPFVCANIYLSSKKTILNLCIHHALYDAISLSHLIEEYKQLLKDTESRYVNDDTVFRNLAFHGVSDSNVANAKTFWTSYLSGSNICGNLWGVIAESKARKEVIIPSAIQVSRDKGASWSSTYSLQAFALACYCKAITKRWPHSFNSELQTDMVIGIYLANRSFDVSRHTWPTVNILPIRIRDPFNGDKKAIAAQIQQDLIEIGNIDNVSSSLWQIYEWTGVRIFSTFNFLAHSESPILGPGLVNIRNGESYKESNLLSPGSLAIGHYDLGKKTFKAPEELQALQNQNIYLNTIDIELDIKGDAIDIGIFGDVKVEDCHELIEDMKFLFKP